jgi:hypothetical protein
MQTIYKYPLKAEEWQLIEMPEGSKILCVQVQGGTPCIWVLCNNVLPMTKRAIYIRATGGNCEGMCTEDYIGTYQMLGGALVFHVFSD